MRKGVLWMLQPDKNYLRAYDDHISSDLIAVFPAINVPGFLFNLFS